MTITETGYHRETFEEILADLTLKTKELFGEDIDVSDQTPLGKILNIMAYYRAKDHEKAELIYYARFPKSAIGTSLDRLCPFVGLKRNVATPARYEVTVTGKEGTKIPFGFLVSTESDVEFYNTIDTTIAEGETTCKITVECTQAGSIGNVLPSDINEIVNPDSGIDSVIGTAVILVGADEESDNDLRKRMDAAVEGDGAGNVAAIRAAIMKVPTVTDAIIIENDTNETDSRGNPPHSIACYVTGGVDYSQQIGEAIFSTKASGIPTNGSISVTVTDIGGYPHTVKYNPTESVDIKVNISINTTADFGGESGIQKIKDNIYGYINSVALGGEIVFSQLYGYIYSVVGVSKVTSLTVNGGTSDISLSYLQKAVCSAVNVTEV